MAMVNHHHVAMVHFATVNTMIEQLRSDDVEARLNSVMNLRVIARALGPERVRSELLPYLSDYLDESDEVQRAFAQILGTFLPEAGGVAYIRDVLTPLELMATTDDVTVRETASQSINQLTATVFGPEGSPEPQQEVVAVVMRLAKSELPQAKCAACGCLSTVYRYGSQAVKMQLRQALQRLCADDELMVRRAAAVALGGDLPTALGPQAVELLPSLNALSKDPSDGVRLHVVAAALQTFPVASDSAAVQLIAILRVLSADASWRVRFMVADRIGDIAATTGAAESVRAVVPMFKALVQDPEAEIRAAAVHHAHAVLGAVTDTTAKKDALSAALRLAKDTNPHVRVNLASGALAMAAQIPKDLWTSSLLPVVTALLADADPDVRLALIGGFRAASGTTTDMRDVAPKLVPAIATLTDDAKWRVRSTVVAQLPSLVVQLGRTSTDVVGMAVKSLQDGVAAIRLSACDACAEMAAANGPLWVKSTLLPMVLPQASSGGYTRRVALVKLLQKLVPHVEASQWQPANPLGAAVATLASDAVANVRMAVATLLVTIQSVAPSRDAEALLARLATDVDGDVRDCAKGLKR